MPRSIAESKHTFDVAEYIVALAKDTGLAPIEPMAKSIGVHFRLPRPRQNMGPKAMEMLRLIPEAKPQLTERCSGHGGKWGIFKENFDRAVKVGKPAGAQLMKQTRYRRQRMSAGRTAPEAGDRGKRQRTARADRPPDRSGRGLRPKPMDCN
jgi:hypothetical protein